MRHRESRLQIECVRWYRAQYPHKERMLYAIPNGGARRPIEAAILKAEGVVAGAPDLTLARAAGGYHGLYIEMKTEKGRQTPSQRAWQADAEAEGYRYVICRSFDEFRRAILEYLEAPGQP